MKPMNQFPKPGGLGIALCERIEKLLLTFLSSKTDFGVVGFTLNIFAIAHNHVRLLISYCASFVQHPRQNCLCMRGWLFSVAQETFIGCFAVCNMSMFIWLPIHCFSRVQSAWGCCLQSRSRNDLN
jgi:hypothetical protein